MPHTLPVPVGDDIDPWLTADRPRRWTCRYCNACEAKPLTADAAVRRRTAHECRCSMRPAFDVPTAHELAVYQSVHAAGLRRDVAIVWVCLDRKRATLSRMWIGAVRKRRALRADIAKLEGCIAGIHAHALAIGLPDGWYEQ